MGVLAAELKRRSASLVLGNLTVISCDVNVSAFNTHAPLNQSVLKNYISNEFDDGNGSF